MYNDLIFFKCTIYYPNAMVIVFFFFNTNDGNS